MRYLWLLFLVPLAACGPSEQEPDYKKDLQVFRDKKIETLFPKEPEMLPIEEDFLGDEVVKKRTYLVPSDDSVSYMVIYLDSEDYLMDAVEDAIEYFKEANMITSMEPFNEESYGSSFYKAESSISDRYFWVKFEEAASSSVMYSMVTSDGAYPDSSMAFYFLDNTGPSGEY